MPLNSAKQFDYIEECLSLLVTRLELRGRFGLFNNHHDAENFYRRLFNLIFQLNLKNINDTVSNAGGIDLVDDDNRIVIQVSSDCSRQKVQDSLKKKFLERYSGYRFQFIAISKDSRPAQNHSYSENPYNLRFNPKTDVLDIKSVLTKIRGLDDLDHFSDIYNYFLKEFESRKSSVSTNLDTFGIFKNPTAADQATSTNELSKLKTMLSEASSVIDQLSVIETSKEFPQEIDNDIHELIDTYRDLLNHGQPKTALPLLEKLKAKHWEKASDRVKFRLLTNIGACLIKIDRNQPEEAIGLFHNALEYQPNDPVALANKALAYLLEGNTEATREAAIHTLKHYPDNESSALYYIEAAVDESNINDPLEAIPKGLHKAPLVLLGLVHFYRRRSQDTWVELAKKAYQAYPDNPSIQRVYAESYIEKVFGSVDAELGEGLQNGASREEIELAISLLQGLWDKQTQTEIRNSELTLPYNLSYAYQANRQFAEARKICDEALSGAPDDPLLIILRSHMYFDDGELEKARSLLEQLLHNTRAQIKILQFGLIQDADEEKHRLTELLKGELSPEAKIEVTALFVQYWFRHKGVDNQETENAVLDLANSLVDEFPQSLAAKLVHLQAISVLQLPITEYIQGCLELVNEETPYADRYVLASILSKHELFNESSELLYGRIDTRYESPALQLLFLGLIRSDQRSRAHLLYFALDDKVAEQRFYLQNAIYLQRRRGDLRAEKSLVAKLARIAPGELSTELAQLDLLLLEHQHDEIVSRLAKIDGTEGSAPDRMRLAFLLVRFGLWETGVECAYQVLLGNFSDPDMHINYFSLILRPELENRLSTKTVKPNTRVTLQNRIGEQKTVVIEENLPNLTTEGLPSSHPFVVAMKSLKVDSTFEFKGQEWSIMGIESKYIYLLHLVMNSFETQFPDNTKLKRYLIDGDSLSIPLKHAKSRHDFVQRVLDKYESSPLPLDCLAFFFDGDAIDVWSLILRQEREFKVCRGTIDERTKALDAIQINDRCGCVLDPLTLHIVKGLQIEDVVQDVCGPIAVAGSTVNLLAVRRDHLIASGLQEQLTVSWVNGELVKEVTTTEEMKSKYEYTNKLIEWLYQSCEILAAEADINIPEEASSIKETVSSTLLDPALAAANSGKILICEDLHFRESLRSWFGLPCTWIQPILHMALEKDIISLNRYCSSIQKLIELRHTFTWVNADTLVHFYIKRNQAAFEVVTRVLFGRNADLRSHLDVLIDVLARIWDLDNHNEVREPFTSILLRRVFYHTSWKQHAFKDASISEITGLMNFCIKSSEFSSYLDRWLLGHFIVLEK